MSFAELQDHFQVFKLPAYATIHDLDEQYHHYSLEIHKQKSAKPDHVRNKQQEYDDTYYILLQHFIRQDCAEGIQRRSSRDSQSTDFIDFSDRQLAQMRAEDPFLLNDNEVEVDEEEDIVVVGERRNSSGSQQNVSARSEVFDIIESQGDIFDAPDNAVIVHAVNCQGVWGTGFAAELRRRFPTAFAEYAHWCHQTKPRSLLAGYCLLIRPQHMDYAGRGKQQPRRWIACLFTSVGYGKPDRHGLNPGKSDEESIRLHTESALLDLRSDLEKAHGAENEDKPGVLYSPKFNSGSFGVPWEDTRRLIAMCFAGYDGVWNVVSTATGSK